MLQAPPHLSRVCGHGHIKKFWLMQTQKESQASERKSNFLFPSPTSCAGSTVSAKGPDSSPRNLQSPVLHGYGDTGTSAKHSSFTCAETLSLSLCKKSPPHLPVSTSPAMKRMVRSSGVDEVCRSLDQEAQPCTPSPRSYPLNVAFGSERNYGDELERMVTKADPEEFLHSQGPNKSEDSLSTSAGDSPHSFNSHGQFHPSRPGKGLLKTSDSSRGNHCTKGEYCSSPAQTSINVGRPMNGDAVPRRMQFPTSSTTEDYGVSRRNSHDTSHTHNEQQYQAVNSGLKACTLCGTTKTPMWRCGPQGPKSLCNACGIRFKKYRSTPGQNEFPSHPVSPSAGHGTPKSLARPLKRKQGSVLMTGEIPRPQKMCLKSVVAGVTLGQENKNEVIINRGDQNQLKRAERVGANRWSTPAAPACFKKIYGCFPFQSKFKKISPIDEHLTLSRVFKDEEEAALLLMHLSCGLVY